MRTWTAFGLGILIGVAAVLFGAGRISLLSEARAQYLERLQNVDVDFETSGNVSTLTFFDRDSGELYIYIATGTGNFRFARRLTLKELGGPLASEVSERLRTIPQLPTGLETEP